MDFAITTCLFQFSFEPTHTHTSNQSKSTLSAEPPPELEKLAPTAQRPNGLEDCVIPRQNPNDFVSATMPWNVEATDFATDLVGFALVGFSFAMNPQFQVGPGRKFEMCEIVSQLGGRGITCYQQQPTSETMPAAY